MAYFDGTTIIVEASKVPVAATDLISFQYNDSNMLFDNELSGFMAYYATRNELSNNQYWISGNPTNSYIGYKFSSPVAVNAYEIVARNMGSSYDISQAPKEWIIQGSNDDGATWSNVHTSGHIFTYSGEHYSEVFSNDVTYKWWRIFVVTAKQTDEGTCIGYFQFRKIDYART